MQQISCFIYISSVIGKVQCLRKKGKTVTPSRRLQAKGVMSTLQMGKGTNIMRKIYQSSRFNEKTAFRKSKIYMYFSVRNGRYAPVNIRRHIFLSLSELK